MESQEQSSSSLARAEEQRFIALRNTFLTLDAFVIPSVSPRMLNEYLKLKDHLIDVYTPTKEVQLFFPEENVTELYNEYQKYINRKGENE